ncbi:MAG: hypothetical protein ACERK6_13295, partial [Candidatus Aminicenantaceae bacterium]
MKPNRRIWVPLLVCALFIPIACKKSGEQTVADRAAERTAAVMPDYVGRQACIECHRDQYDLFVGSDHD